MFCCYSQEKSIVILNNQFSFIKFFYNYLKSNSPYYYNKGNQSNISKQHISIVQVGGKNNIVQKIPVVLFLVKQKQKKITNEWNLIFGLPSFKNINNK